MGQGISRALRRDMARVTRLLTRTGETDSLGRSWRYNVHDSDSKKERGVSGGTELFPTFQSENATLVWVVPQVEGSYEVHPFLQLPFPVTF